MEVPKPIEKDTISQIEKKGKGEETVEYVEMEQTLLENGLVDIQKVDSSLMVEVRYSTSHNFMKKPIYDEVKHVFLQKEVAKRLSKAQQALQAKDSSLCLLVFDGARPLSVQQKMWDALDTIPFGERVKFLSNPANGSIHNYGCAVDLTIVDCTTGEELDMGATYDDLRKIAYPRHEEKFLKSGELTQEQLQNRKLLREVMRVGGFWVIETEWWHFNAFTRDKAKEIFELIE